MPAATIVRADDPSYWRWQAAAARRKATILGYAYDPDGVKKAAFTPWVKRTRRNPDPDGETMSVHLGDDFLSKALDDYQQWTRAWWREAIQNCVDAGATRIDMHTKTLSDGRYEVTVTDNGRGMSAEILFKKFLSLGSSGKKDSPTATGGFGEAKRLLLFPWCQWSILTNGADGPLGVVGHGFAYKKVQNVDAKGTGTSLIIVMPADKHVDPVDAEWFVSKCYLPNIKIFLNGTKLDADMKAGESIDCDFEDTMKLYYSPRARNARGFFIRKNGLLMYEKFTGPDTLKGVLIGEIVPPSVEVLQSNRDGLRRGEWKLDDFLQSLAKDTGSKLKKSKAERTMFKGNREVIAVVEDTQGKLFDILGRHFSGKKNKAISEQACKDLDTALAALPADMGPGVMAPTPGVAQIIMEGIDPENSTTEIEAAAKQLAWAADFYVVNDIDDYKVPKWLKPEGMKARPRKVARLWMEYCRLILIRLGYKGKFGVGWIFSTNSVEKNGYTMACYTRDQGTDWLLINPFIGGNKDKEEIYSIREPKHLNDLFAIALHECTHLVDRISYHDESFTSALTMNIAKVLPSTSMMLKVRNAVAAIREEDKSEAVVEKAKNIPALAKIVYDRFTEVATNGDVRKSVREVADAAESWNEVNKLSQSWFRTLTGESPNSDYITSNIRDVMTAMRSSGLHWNTVLIKLLDTVPAELCPNKLSFDEFKDVLAYAIWRAN